MRIFITGGTGFVGSYVLRELKARGHEMVALVRSRKKLDELSEFIDRTVMGDLDDERALEEGLAGAEAVVHVAGQISPVRKRSFQHVNVDGTTRVLNAASRSAGALERFVYVSSIAASGPSLRGEPRREEDPPHPVSAYGRSKLVAERAVNGYRDHFATTIVRPPVVYGPGDTWTLPFFRMVQSGTVWSVNDPKTRISLIHVADLASGIAEALEREAGANETFFLAGDTRPAIRELIGAIEDALSRQVRIRRVPRTLANAAALGGEALARVRGRASPITRDRLRELLAPGWSCSVEKAREKLEWRAEIDFRSGLREAAEWYRDRGWLEW